MNTRTRGFPVSRPRYNVSNLVYYEEFRQVRDAIAREKEIKGWLRARKVALVESVNPGWNDLSCGWYDG